MKADKTKLHQVRKGRKVTSAAHVADEAITDLELMLNRLERSPKQENL
jgi:hypothetical protein